MAAINAQILVVQADKHRLVRDLDVANAKKIRMTGKAKEFKTLAKSIQEKFETTVNTSSIKFLEMENQFDVWKEVSNERDEEKKLQMIKVHDKYNGLVLQYDTIEIQYWNLKMKWSNDVQKWRHYVCLSKALHGWYSVILGQRVGARIALRSTQDCQRMQLRNHVQSERNSNKMKEQSNQIQELNNIVEQMKTKRNEENTSKDEYIAARTKMLEQIAEERLHALEHIKEEKNRSEKEILLLENENKDLRERCVIVDSIQLTASVLENEVNLLKDNLEMARGFIDQKNDEMNEVRLELENLIE